MNNLFTILVLVLLSFGSYASDKEYMPDVSKLLEEIVDVKRASADLVGLGAIVVQGGEVIGLSVSGERKRGSKTLVTSADKWHIGSITKSFTATMIARLIENGTLNWDTAIGDVFSDGGQIHPSWRNVTLGHLLTHTSGAAPNFSLLINIQKPEMGADTMAARESAVQAILAKPPKGIPGNAFVYSNIGYTIAGVIAEKKTGISWENLIIREVFSPLGINSGGFGTPQDSKGKLSQPWGHHKNIFGLKVSTKSDNTSIIGPAGNIHLSLKDLAVYGNEHLQGMQGQGSLLERSSYERLHHPNLNNYAYGWVIASPKNLDVGSVHWHNGSNTMWYSLLVVLPSINTVIAITSNDGQIQAAEQAAWEIVKHLAKPLATLHQKSINMNAVGSANY